MHYKCVYCLNISTKKDRCEVCGRTNLTPIFIQVQTNNERKTM